MKMTMWYARSTRLVGPHNVGSIFLQAGMNRTISDGLCIGKTGTCAALVLLFIISMPRGTGASCFDYPTGACSWGNSPSLRADCDCDEYGCTIPGPPYYVCATQSCSLRGLLSTWFCEIPLGYTSEVCVPFGFLWDVCPCSGITCWFEAY